MLIPFGLAFILFATLTPFDYLIPGQAEIVPWSQIIQRFDFDLHQGDTIENIILFLPLGFGLAALTSRRMGFVGRLILIGLAGGVLSLTIEILQAFSPVRASSLADVINNTLGSALGVLLHRYFGTSLARFAIRFREWSRRHIPLLAWTAVLAAYFAVLFSAAAEMGRRAQLHDWPDRFPLLLGNESSANRPWAGTVSHLVIARRAADDVQRQRLEQGIDPREVFGPALLVDLPLTGAPPYHDRAGNLPDLVVHGTQLPPSPDAGASLGPGRWLATAEPARAVLREIAAASQFTVALIAASATTDQAGPARLVTFSQGTGDRAFTIGQEGAELVVRVRTPLTGDNGMEPEAYVPDVFTDSRPHRIVVTYDGANLRIFLDGSNRPFVRPFTPDYTLLRAIGPGYWRHMRAYQHAGYVQRLLFAALIFVPVGWWTRAGWQRQPSRAVARRTAVLLGGIGLCVAGAIASAGLNHRGVTVAGLCLGFGLATAAAVYGHGDRAFFLRPASDARRQPQPSTSAEPPDVWASPGGPG